MLKSPIAFIAISLTLPYVVFQLLIPKPKKVAPSDVAVIFNAIKNGCPNCIDRPYDYVLNTSFTSFRSNAYRKQVISSSLTGNTRAPFIARLDPACLLVPNTSKELQVLRSQLRQPKAKNAMVYELTFSEPCLLLPDSVTCYYVEKRSQNYHRGDGSIYALKNGVIVSHVYIWTN